MTSTLVVHHLEDGHKRALFDAIHEALVHGGWFVNGDVIALPDHLKTVADARTGCAKGWSEEAFMDRWQASDDFDDSATLFAQLEWLRESGFEDVSPVWQYYNFAVYGGRKPGEG